MLSSTHRASAQRKKKKLLAHATVSDGSAPYGKELNSNQLSDFGNKVILAISKIPKGCQPTKITPQGNLLFKGQNFGLNCVGVVPIF